MAQLLNTIQEDHTEQNRFLRKYATVSSTIDHLHTVYGAHLSVLVSESPTDMERYQTYFDFFGTLSLIHWQNLVFPAREGKAYFNILNKYSILPHLSKANFASRPVAREGQEYNIETIRAIPFTMVLAQLREFINGYYGTGTAFQKASEILTDPKTPLALLSIAKNLYSEKSIDQILSDPQHSNLRGLISDSEKKTLEKHNNQEQHVLLEEVINLYPTKDQGIRSVSYLLNDLKTRGVTVLKVIKEMYTSYAPFRYSLQNKESSLVIRSKKIVDDYTRRASTEEKQVLEHSEREAELTKKWIMNIMEEKELHSKMLSNDFNSPELALLHKIQVKFLEEYKTESNKNKLRELQVYIQMTILAISEALGFGG
eukprot:TRINITY_DN632_c0_g2_i1.p1 TRINITY_DN632_c0_g2~~TRINITY_DN632_c0_g2_i1.p1  ORF type:complete len:370 (-),score=68.75 TRINITY_DN632_c0_g2_i1:450-1559(-)